MNDAPGQAELAAALAGCPQPVWSEETRLAALASYAILDTGREPEFDEVAELAAYILDAPIAVVNFIAADRQWFKAEKGIGADSLPLDVSICRHAILQPGVLVVPDLSKDPRFEGNPLVMEGGLRFYAGALLETPEGLPLGTVCVLDSIARPHGISARQERALRVLARQIMGRLELRRSEAARAAAEARLRLATSGAGVGTWELDIAADRGRWSEEAVALFGFHRAEFTSADWVEALHPDDRARATDAWRRAVEDGERYEIEYRAAVPAPDGSERWLLSRGRVERDADGQPTRGAGVLLDVTERRIAERAQAFRLSVTEALRDLSDPQAMMDAATALLGRHLGAAQVGFAEVEDDQAHITVARDWNDGRIASVAGRWRMDDFGPAFVREMKAGRTIVIPAVEADPRTAAADVIEAYRGIGVRAILDRGLVRDGRMLAMLFIHHPEPRAWTPDEVAIVEEVTDRLWAAVERARADARLRASEAFARIRAEEVEAVYAAAPVGLAVLDRNLRYLRINERLAEINGVPVADHIGRTVQEVVPDISGQAVQALNRVLAGEEVRGLEITGTTPAMPGVERTWRENWLPMRDSQGVIIGVTVSAEEITQEKAAHVALTASEARFRAVAATSPSIIWLADAKGQVEFLSPRWVEVTGVDAHDISTCYHPDDEGPARDAAGKAIATGTGHTAERRLRLKDGRYGWHRVDVVPVHDAAGQVAQWLGVTTDIDALKRTEAELRQALADKDMLAREIDHRVKNSLAVVGNLLFLQERTARSDEAKAVLKEASARLMTVARIHEQLYQGDPRHIAFERYLDSLCRDLSRSFGSAGDVAVDADAVDLPAEAAIPLGLVAAELVTNAIKHAGHDGKPATIRVALRRAGAKLLLEVIDDGPGLPDDFEPEASRGLGMRVVRSLVRQLGGSLQADNRTEGGARFSVKVPSRGEASEA